MTLPVPESQQQYGSILTVLGENAEQNGKLLNKQLEITHMAIGDANDQYVQPDRKQTALVNELARIEVNSVDVLQPTPESIPMLKVEAILPDEVNDIVIREFAAVATFNGQTYFHAIGNCARVYVPPPVNNGNVRTPVTLEMIFVITSAEPIVEIDPHVVTASREYVHKQINHSDERLAQTVVDQNGMDWFIEDGFLVTPQSGSFKIQAGAGYVSGNRVSMEFDSFIQVLEKPAFIYIDAWREGIPTGEWETKSNFIVSADGLDDYLDEVTSPATPHFVCKIAQVMADGSVCDVRKKGKVDSYAALIHNLHASRESINWAPNLKVIDPLQIYVHEGVEYLPNCDELPFETAERWSDDLSEERWSEISLMTMMRYWRDIGDIRGWGAKLDGEDESEILKEALSSGVEIYVPTKYKLTIKKELELLSDNARLIGGCIVCSGSFYNVINNKANNLTISNVSFEGVNCDIQSVVRSQRGSKKLKIKSCSFSGFYSTTWHFTVSIQCEDADDFLIDDCSFYDISCLGNGLVSDTYGAVRAIRTDYADKRYEQTGGIISNIFAHNVNTVNEVGEPILEDADLIQVGGGSNINISNVQAIDVGKRVIKVQTDGVNINNVYCESKQELPHYCIVECFDDNIAVSNIQGVGNINAIFNTSQRKMKGIVANNMILNTSFKGSESSLACVDIKGGDGVSISNVVVNGGAVGLRVSVEADGINVNNLNVSNCRFNIPDGYAVLFRNLYFAEIPSHLSFSGCTFKGGGLSGLIGTIVSELRRFHDVKFDNCSFVYTGTGYDSVKLDETDNVGFSNCYFSTSNEARSLRISDSSNVTVNNIFEASENLGEPVVYLERLENAIISGITGDFVATGFKGLVQVEGCSSTTINNISVRNGDGTAISFIDSNSQPCKGCHVDSIGSVIYMAPEYTGINVIDSNALACGPIYLRPKTIGEGFSYFSTDEPMGFHVWSEGKWVFA